MSPQSRPSVQPTLDQPCGSEPDTARLYPRSGAISAGHDPGQLSVGAVRGWRTRATLSETRAVWLHSRPDNSSGRARQEWVGGEWCMVAVLQASHARTGKVDTCSWLLVTPGYGKAAVHKILTTNVISPQPSQVFKIHGDDNDWSLSH